MAGGFFALSACFSTSASKARSQSSVPLPASSVFSPQPWVVRFQLFEVSYL